MREPRNGLELALYGAFFAIVGGCLLGAIVYYLGG